MSFSSEFLMNKKLELSGYSFICINLLILVRRWHVFSAKSTKLIVLVTMRISAGANAWRKVDGVM